MRKAFLAAGLLAALSASPASATSVTWDSSNTLNVGEDVVETFANPGTTPISLGGTSAYAYNSDVAGVAVLPRPAGNTGSTDGFGAVLGGGEWTYTLTGPMQVFSFLLGGLDTYNSVTLHFTSGSDVSYNGSQLAAMFSLPANGSATGRLRFDQQGGAGITGVTFASGQNSLEFDDFAVAAPEPATWAMMIFGFGVVGAGMRRRRRTDGLAHA